MDALHVEVVTRTSFFFRVTAGRGRRHLFHFEGGPRLGDAEQQRTRWPREAAATHGRVLVLRGEGVAHGRTKKRQRCRADQSEQRASNAAAAAVSSPSLFTTNLELLPTLAEVEVSKNGECSFVVVSCFPCLFEVQTTLATEPELMFDQPSPGGVCMIS